MPSLLGGWGEFAAAFATFMAAHVVPSRPAIRTRLVSALGLRTYMFLYITLSIALLGWLIAAAGRAPYVALWGFQPWQLWAPNIAMPLACLLFAFGAATSNPLSIASRRNELFDHGAPGVVGIVRHPVLWGFALWAGAHLIANGNLAHLLLFGGFTAFAFAGMIVLDRRLQRRIGMEEWRRLAYATSNIPLATLVSGRWRPGPIRISVRRLAAAIMLYVVFLLAHRPVIGVSPLPVF